MGKFLYFKPLKIEEKTKLKNLEKIISESKKELESIKEEIRTIVEKKKKKLIKAPHERSGNCHMPKPQRTIPSEQDKTKGKGKVVRARRKASEKREE